MPGKAPRAPADTSSCRRRGRPRGHGGDLLGRQARRIRAAALVHAAHVPPRHDRLGAVRARRPDDPVFRGLGRKADGGLRLPARQSGVAPVRSVEGGAALRVALRGDGCVGRPSRCHSVQQNGNAGPYRDDGRRHAEGGSRGHPLGGLGARRPEPGGRPPAGRKGAAGVSGRQGPVRDRRLDLPSEGLAPRRRGRLSGSRPSGRRLRNGDARRPRRETADDHEFLRERAGTLLVARRRGGLLLGDVHRRQSCSPGGDPLRPRAGSRAGHGLVHGPGRLEERPHPDHRRQGAKGDVGAPARLAEGAGLFVARLVAPAGDLGGRADAALRRERSGGRTRLFRLRAEGRRVAGRAARAGRGRGPVSRRTHRPRRGRSGRLQAPRAVSHRGGRAEGTSAERSSDRLRSPGSPTAAASSSPAPSPIGARVSGCRESTIRSPGPSRRRATA